MQLEGENVIRIFGEAREKNFGVSPLSNQATAYSVEKLRVSA